MDITIGHNSTTPSDLLEAAGRRLAPDEKLRCIGCHSTGAVRKRELLLNELTPGVQCSHCHEKRFYSFNREIDARVSHFQRRLPAAPESSAANQQVLALFEKCRDWVSLPQASKKTI